jgi:hypothetical protein
MNNEEVQLHVECLILLLNTKIENCSHVFYQSEKKAVCGKPIGFTYFFYQKPDYCLISLGSYSLMLSA